MACNTLTGIVKGCDGNQGGIYSVYINDTDNVSSVALNESGHTITGITATPDFTTFEFKRNIGNVVIDPKIDLINGSTYYEATITLAFHRREASKSRALQILAEGQRYLDIIFLDANGLYWYVDHAQLTGGTEETGTARADGSKLNVTFVAQMSNRPYAVTQAAVTAVI
jgi:hypothetical protein